MGTPVVTFFNNKGGVAKTTLVYHLAWMLRELGLSVVAVDLDPQANLTASFLNDDSVEKLWSRPRRLSVYGALEPLFGGTGGIADPHVEEIAPNLGLVPGDVLLSGTEQELSLAWATSLGGGISAIRAFTLAVQLGITRSRALGKVCYAYMPDQGGVQPLARLAETYGDITDDDASFAQFCLEVGPVFRSEERRGRK